jgi:uncharacterized protein DUF3106
MNCQQLRERLVDPSSASHGGHAAVVEHVESCPECRATSRAYAGIERLFRPETAGAAPEDFASRVVARLAEAPRRVPLASRVPKPVLLAAGGGLLALVVLVLLLRSRGGEKTSAALPARARPAATKPAPRKAEAPPPSILAVGSAPLDVNAPQISDGERAQVFSMFDSDFLLFADALAALDAFYPEDDPVAPRIPPSPPAPAAARPPESRDQRDLRLLAWRSMPAAERARVTALDRDHRKLSAERRAALERRWSSVGWFPEEERVGIRRILFRIAELDPARRAQVAGRIRAVAVEPVELRGELWRSLPFTLGLTGQERTAGERLLIAR